MGGEHGGERTCRRPAPPTYLVDAEADGVHVLAHLALPPPVLLDEPHQEGAATLAVLLVLVLLLQLDEVLWVHPEGVCARGRAGQAGRPALSRCMAGVCVWGVRGGSALVSGHRGGRGGAGGRPWAEGPARRGD